MSGDFIFILENSSFLISQLSRIFTERSYGLTEYTRLTNREQRALELGGWVRDERKETELIGRPNYQSLPDSGDSRLMQLLKYHLHRGVY